MFIPDLAFSESARDKNKQILLHIFVVPTQNESGAPAWTPLTFQHMCLCIPRSCHFPSAGMTDTENKPLGVTQGAGAVQHDRLSIICGLNHLVMFL